MMGLLMAWLSELFSYHAWYELADINRFWFYIFILGVGVLGVGVVVVGGNPTEWSC